MVQLTRFFTAGLMLCLIVLATGCKTEPKADEAPIPATRFKFSMIKHPVAEYTAWKAVYEAQDSLRTAFGMSKFVLARGTDDPGMVFVVHKIADLSKAKEFIAHPDLAAAMANAGVTAPPTVAFADMIRIDTSTNPGNDRLLISHRVKDFDAWLKVYDAEGRTARTANGLQDRALSRDLDDPNMVYVAFVVTDREKANARMQSEDLKKLMTDAGVEGPPTFFYYTVDPSH